MHVKLFPLLLLCLLCALPSLSQSVAEDGSSIKVTKTGFTADLKITHTGGRVNTPVTIEILDISSNVIAKATKNFTIINGTRSYRLNIPVSTDTLKVNSSDLPWYRMRYSVADNTGVISFSEMIDELFITRTVTQSNLVRGGKFNADVYVSNPFNNSPVAGVKVTATLCLELEAPESDDDEDDDHEEEIKLVGISDAKGLVKFSFQLKGIKYKIDDASLDIEATKNGITTSDYISINSIGKEIDLAVITDKPIYQPEQMLHVRGLLMETGESFTILNDKTLEFRIEDEEGTLLYREKVKTSDFGLAFISWQIPANAKLGNYEIEIRDENNNDLVTKNFKVTRYDLPNFVVNGKAEKKYYLPNENLAEIEVSADYLFGQPVLKGKVRVVREKDRRWNWREQKYDIEEGEKHEGETDEEGKFKATFDLKDEQKEFVKNNYSKYKDLRFTAYFTDLATNRTEERRFDVRLSQEPIHVYYKIAGNEIFKNMPLTVYASANYADGEEFRGKITLLGSPEYENDFKQLAVAETNDLGIAVLKFTPAEPSKDEDELELKFIASDAEGRIGTDNRRIDYSTDEKIWVTPEKTIYRSGESIRLYVQSTFVEGEAVIQLIKNNIEITRSQAYLKNGKAELQIPYDPIFSGEIVIGAYALHPDHTDELVVGSSGVIYPAPTAINTIVEFDKTIYKPGEDVNIDFNVIDTAGRAIESALGIVIFDKAVEERARTDGSPNSIFGDFNRMLGYGKSFAGINVKNIHEADTTKSISNDMQTAAAAIMAGAYYEPKIELSRDYTSYSQRLFAGQITSKFNRFSSILSTYVRYHNDYPTNEQELKKVLKDNGMPFDEMLDPWDQNFHINFEYSRNRLLVSVLSTGTDKKIGTKDDIIAATYGFNYFDPIGKKIDAAMEKYLENSSVPVTTKESFYDVIGMDELIDIYGRPYDIDFRVNGRRIIINIVSRGKDGQRNGEYVWSGDDFNVWQFSQDYFKTHDDQINRILNVTQPLPQTNDEFINALKKAGVEFDNIKDGHNNQVYLVSHRRHRFHDKRTTEKVYRYGDIAPSERIVITPVTQELIEFRIRSRGKDKIEGTSDDETISSYILILSEQSKDDEAPVSTHQKISYGNTTSIKNFGSINGTVSDTVGSVLPGAEITAESNTGGFKSSSVTNSNGRYVIAGLPAGTYDLRADAPGFKSIIVQGVPVRAGQTVIQNLSLDIGDVSEVVTVSGGGEVLQSQTATIGSTIEGRQILETPAVSRDALHLVSLLPGTADVGRPRKNNDNNSGTLQSEETSTPRLREYFPETLLWHPELVTDKKGQAKLHFTMADSITTWKVYTIASTKDGKVGISEKEILSFKSFFADLDPPKFLTVGDEISLPVQIRNYTKEDKSVNATMEKADWFSFFNCSNGAANTSVSIGFCESSGAFTNKVNVASGQTENAVFGFKAEMAVKGGKQQVTAIAKNESDAIEKPVTVRPDGQEKVNTETKFTLGSAEFDLHFPSNALLETHFAELKIYPNLMAHVSESVEGLLQRPYGCGEQMISSTYPNLMILKFAYPDGMPDADEDKAAVRTNHISATVENKARRNLAKGYEGIIGYQSSSGGFTYWGGRSEPNISLTAYALRFFADAEDFIEVDEKMVKRAEDWIISQQRPDGSWTQTFSWEQNENHRRTMIMTTHIARSLAMTKPTYETRTKTAVDKALNYLQARVREIDEPFAIATLGLAALDLGNLQLADWAAGNLKPLAKNEAGGIYWNLESNTPFYGWGLAGRIETTALATQLLIRLGRDDAAEKELISKAMTFLMRNKDRYGVWYSTQTTINVLDTLLAGLGNAPVADKQISIIVNGKIFKEITVKPEQIEQLSLDLKEVLLPTSNDIKVNVSDNSAMMLNLVAGHYVDWNEAEVSQRNADESRTLRLDYTCDKYNTAIMDEVTCRVEAERIGFRGYGMLLAEIGTPPGADIDRETLKNAVDANQISRYDILPDRIIIYTWARPGGTRFDFKFKPRYGINAQTPASIAYDYYNPEAQAIVKPLRFVVN